MTPREVIAQSFDGPFAPHERLSRADRIIHDLATAGYWIAPMEPIDKLIEVAVLAVWDECGEMITKEAVAGAYRAMRDEWMKENGG